MKLIEKTTEATENAARELRQKLQFKAEDKFIKKVMKWEKCTRSEAIDYCIGKSPVRHPEYILGYRMSDPVLMQAMYCQIKKENRDKVKADFRATLDPDCRELFDNECKGMGDEYRKEYRAKGGRF